MAQNTSPDFTLRFNTLIHVNPQPEHHAVFSSARDTRAALRPESRNVNHAERRQILGAADGEVLPDVAFAPSRIVKRGRQNSDFDATRVIDV